MSGMDSHGNEEVANIIEAILLLWQIFHPVEDIAQRLHLNPADVQHVIDHGCFPARQLKLAWADSVESAAADSRSYDFGRESQR